MSSGSEVPGSVANTQAKSLKRACDCCRKRKVKCDGEDPCGPCRKATIRCAYLQAPKKKGPKGLRSARVLHALRKIDEAAPITPQSPLSPMPQSDDLSRWSWSSKDSSPSAGPAPGAYIDHAQYPPGFAQSRAPSGASYFQDSRHVQGMYPSHHQIPHHPRQGLWVQTYTDPELPEPQQSYPALETQPASPLIPNERFLPYVQLFFNHLFPIQPIIDRAVYLDPALYDKSSCLSSETYAFLCALSAATIVQLDATAEPPSFQGSEAEVLITECLRARLQFDYIGKPTTTTIMTSFFIFAYYGNDEKAEKAWHYLQESISFTESLDMDDERAYDELDPIEAQWRRRLYWLLFVTERAYSIQRRKPARLHASIQLPLSLESEDPVLLNGFINLVHLFSAIGDQFVNVWRGTRRGSLCSAPWLAETQRSLDGVAIALGNISETQQLDISVSREWLHVLAWQLGVRDRLISGKGEGSMRLEYPVELARRVVCITEHANTQALDSHGIGMEQKLSDIAGCLADVLRVSAWEMSDTVLHGRQYLGLLVNKLSSMRGKESRYLKPLMLKVGNLLEHGIPQTLMSLPPPIAPMYIQSDIQPIGQVYDEETTAVMQEWAQRQRQFGMSA